MRIRLSDCADVAQIVSGIAVVFTLVFLVVGINENTEIARAAAYESQITSLNDIRKTLVQDQELMLAWQAYQRGEIQKLSDVDRMRVEYQVNVLWAVYEKAYVSFTYGIIGATEWPRFERLICRNSQLLRANAMEDIVNPQLTREFVDFVEKSCRE